MGPGIGSDCAVRHGASYGTDRAADLPPASALAAAGAHDEAATAADLAPAAAAAAAGAFVDAAEAASEATPADDENEGVEAASAAGDLLVGDLGFVVPGTAGAAAGEAVPSPSLGSAGGGPTGTPKNDAPSWAASQKASILEAESAHKRRSQCNALSHFTSLQQVMSNHLLHMSTS